MSLTLTLDGGGGAAEIRESDGAFVVLYSATAWPPGSLLSGSAKETSRPYRVKVRTCRRMPPETAPAATGAADLPFRVEGRFVDITREQRDLLAAILRP
ncbi:MAG TPA: hypothetical protein VH142_17875 [Polyangiaceae bacterium]|nr:hypothetical protein [Polyangiaceae bacterium]